MPRMKTVALGLSLLLILTGVGNDLRAAGPATTQATTIPVTDDQKQLQALWDELAQARAIFDQGAVGFVHQGPRRRSRF